MSGIAKVLLFMVNCVLTNNFIFCYNWFNFIY